MLKYNFFLLDPCMFPTDFSLKEKIHYINQFNNEETEGW